MITWKPIVPTRHFHQAVALYRGVSEEQKQRAIALRRMAPKIALMNPQRPESLRSPQLLDHVLGNKRDHAVSWSFERGTAVWWATKLGERRGHVVPKTIILETADSVGGGRAALFGAVGSSWIVSGEILPPFLSSGGIGDWLRAGALANANYEFLLVGGQIDISDGDFEEVGPRDCAPEHRPAEIWPGIEIL